MDTQRRKEAIEYIEGQLTYGYIDLGFHDQDELSIIEEALELLDAKIIEIPGMNPIWLRWCDNDRITTISRRLNISNSEVIQRALRYYEDNLDKLENDVKRGYWIYWEGWCGNHDMRIDNAVCSECGYKHPTVRWKQGDPRGEAAYEAVLNKLKDRCPECGAAMLRG